jgi:taurine dioxygenase
VLAVRGQQFTPPQFIAAAQVFGELFQHDKREMHVPGYPQIYYVSNEQTVPGKRYTSGETFHTDHSNHPAPPKATMPFPVSLPSRGGDTQYATCTRPMTICRRRPRSASTGSRRSMFI